LFAWICIVAWIPLLPESLATWVPRTSPEYRLARGTNVLVLALLAYVLTWNVRTLGPRGYDSLGRLLHIDQNWSLFTPEPPDDRGWYVVPVRLDDGRGFDFMTGKPITWDKPPLISAMYPDHRWRKYFLSLRADHRAAHRPYFAEYVCRSDPAIESVEIFYVFEAQRVEDRYKVSLLEYRCGTIGR
jgi:hypothetical protein